MPRNERTHAIALRVVQELKERRGEELHPEPTARRDAEEITRRTFQDVPPSRFKIKIRKRAR